MVLHMPEFPPLLCPSFCFYRGGGEEVLVGAESTINFLGSVGLTHGTTG